MIDGNPGAQAPKILILILLIKTLIIINSLCIFIVFRHIWFLVLEEIIFFIKIFTYFIGYDCVPTHITFKKHICGYFDRNIKKTKKDKMIFQSPWDSGPFPPLKSDLLCVEICLIDFFLI